MVHRKKQVEEIVENISYDQFDGRIELIYFYF